MHGNINFAPIALNTTRQDKIESLDSDNGEQNSIQRPTQQIEVLAMKLSTEPVEHEIEPNSPSKPEMEQTSSRE